MSEQSSTPATDAGTTKPAGDGIDDTTMAEQVGGQTDSDLKHEDVFEREADGATSDVEAAKADADEIG